MARRRKPHVAPRKSTRRSSQYHCEALEDRTYFVVLHSGDVFEFYAENTHYERIVVGGNPGSTTVEFIGGRVNTQTNQFSITPMQGTLNGADFNGGFINSQANQQQSGSGATQQQVSDTIYAVYITKSDASTSIAVAGVPDLTATSRPMQPYSGSVGSVRANTTTGNRLVGAPQNTGSAYLGARTVNTQNQQGNDQIPIISPIIATNAAMSTPGNPSTIQGSLYTGPGVIMTPGNQIGQFLWGGTITGTVNLHGSVGLFYAGWLLTGNARGAGLEGTAPTRNFNVDGDIHTLLVDGSIGTDNDTPSKFPAGAPTDPTEVPYASDFDMYVGGRAGVIQSLDSIAGNIHVANSEPLSSFNNVPYQELENIGPTGFDPWDGGLTFNGSGSVFSINPNFGALPGFTDDTFNNPQYLGTIDPQGDVVVNGLIQKDAANVDDSVDFYAVPLMAGQTVTVQLKTVPNPLTNGTLPVDVGVFDPDGRLVATDYSTVDPSQTSGIPFQFTAQHPGAYRFAVGLANNNNFAATTGPVFYGDAPYQLHISNVGDLGLGAIVATNNITDLVNWEVAFGSVPIGPSGNPIGFDVYNGDLGGVIAGWHNPNAISTTNDETGLVISPDEGAAAYLSSGGSGGGSGPGYTIGVDNGNLRAVSGIQIGVSAPNTSNTGGGGGGSGSGSGAASSGSSTYGDWPTPYIPHGSVGLLQSTGMAPGEMLAWNDIVSNGEVLNASQSLAASIGGDYQEVDAAQDLSGTYIAQGNIGSVRAVNMDSAQAPGYFQVNAANDPAKHGVIDLIDISQQIGTIAGGPAIVTGPGGNVRYIHCGTTNVFRDPYFGGGQPDLTNYQPGETATITDDSGTNVLLSPANAADSLIVLTYPIRGSGGSVIVHVQVTNTNNPANAGGLNVTATGVGSAEIGTIELDGQGTNVTMPAPTPAPGGSGSGTRFPGAGQPGGPPIVNPNGGKLSTIAAPGTPVLTGTVKPLTVTYTGNVTLDTWEIMGPTQVLDGNFASISTENLVPGMGQVTSIVNNTPGSEIVNLHLTSLGSLTTSGTLGLAAAHATLAAVSGNIRQRLTEDGTSGEPWNYPFAQPTAMVRVLGNIGSITAAAGVGNIYAGVVIMDTPPEPLVPHLAVTPLLGGPSISGGTNGNVGPITTGLIEGPVVAAGGITSVVTRGVTWSGSGGVGSGLFAVNAIGPVTVNGVDRGASISATTGQIGLTVNGVLLDAVVGNMTRFDFSEARSGGGLIPVVFGIPITRPTLDIGYINVTGNGGIMGTEIVGNNIGPITVAKTGFGIFDSFLGMNGNGTSQAVTAGGYGVRDGLIGGGASIGPVIATGDGSNISVLNFPSIVLQSMTGAEFDPVTGQPLNFDNDIAAYLGATKANPQIAGVTDTGVIENFTERGSRDSGGLSAWSIRGRDLSQTTSVPTSSGGPLVNTTTVAVANSVNYINVTGPVNGLTLTTGRGVKYKFGGDVGNLDMTVAGPIQNLVFNNSLLANSTINASGPSGRIGNLTIHGNFNGTIRASTRIQHVVIDGNMVGTISANWLGYLKLGAGLGPGSLAIAGDVRQIVIPGSLSSPGNTLTVNGNLGSLKVGGNFDINLKVLGNMSQFVVNGNIIAGSTSTISKTLSLLKVGGDLQAGATVQAHVIKRKIIKGQTLGSILQV